MKNRILLLLFFSLAMMKGGCASIPDEQLALQNGTPSGIAAVSANCDPRLLSASPPVPPPFAPALDPNGFDLMNWNMLKGIRAGWENDFRQIGENRDLFTIQEAYLTAALRKVLLDDDLNWNLAAAYEFLGKKTGVLTASKIAPGALCMIRNDEPLLRLPKTILITRYPLTNKKKSLLVANVHAINFSLRASHFLNQWLKFENLLSAYDGPIILAGDFNTWSGERLSIVRQTTGRLGLTAVRFERDNRTTVFGYPLDHIYYRGLTPVKAVVFDVTTSDHAPMVVTFKVPGIES